MTVVVKCMNAAVKNSTSWWISAGIYSFVLGSHTVLIRLETNIGERTDLFLKYSTLFFRQAGAVGSRLTGAGWGGCTVSLVPVDVIDDFMKQVHDGYYAAEPAKLERASESLFATQPGSGAAILKLD